MPRPRRAPELRAAPPVEPAQWSRALARVLRRWRHEHDTTAQQLAERCDLDLRQIQRFESGEGNPTMETFVRLAAALHQSPSHVLALIEGCATGRPRNPGTPALAEQGSTYREPGRGTPERSSMNRLALAVRERRAVLSLSQAELAVRAGISRSRVQRIETEKHAVALDTLDSLAAVLGCDVAELLATR